MTGDPEEYERLDIIFRIALFIVFIMLGIAWSSSKKKEAQQMKDPEK